jgi:hypothetical protein
MMLDIAWIGLNSISYRGGVFDLLPIGCAINLPSALFSTAGSSSPILKGEMKVGRRAISIHEQKGGIMGATFGPKDIDQLLAEADELIKQTDSNAIKNMEEEHRIQFENHAQRLKTLRSEVQEKRNMEGTPESGAYSEGMHKAIDEIVTAMKNLGSYFSSG